MKTSFILLLLVFNTTLIFVEPLAELVQGVNMWYFVSFELILIICFVTYKLLCGIKKVFDIGIEALEIFSFKGFNNK